MMTKSKALELVSNCISRCYRCSELSNYRVENQYATVPGEGHPNARIMLIGEAPGENEAKYGRPFVGRAGNLLDGLLKMSGFKREDLFICNILKCRPPDNRNPNHAEANNCRSFLNLQIRIVDPQYIVCLGRVASLHLLKPDNQLEEKRWYSQSMSMLRKKVYDYQNKKVLCTYHPSYLLRQPTAEKLFLDDLESLSRIMQGKDPLPEKIYPKYDHEKLSGMEEQRSCAISEEKRRSREDRKDGEVERWTIQSHRLALLRKVADL